MSSPIHAFGRLPGAPELSPPAGLPPVERTVRHVTVSRRPSVDELMAAHTRRLVCFEGEVIRDAAVLEAQRLRIEAVWGALPPPGLDIGVPEVRLGASDRTFSPYTQIEEHHPPLDPVNLVFWGNAPVERVVEVMRSLEPAWIDSDLVKGTDMRCPLGAMPQAMWVRPSAGAPRFEWNTHSLSPQGFELERIHVRLFAGGTDPADGGWGRWSLGAVHLEEVEPGELDHTVRHWDAAQDQAARAVAEVMGAPAVPLLLQPPGEVLRGVAHDGVATAVHIR